MLKLKEPISLTANINPIKINDGFGKRITGNYELILNDITSNDLMHAFTQPPEVFLAEGETTNIFNNNINITNQQNKKLEILNNLINRILISDSQDFTYQDKVYISSVLNKLGIKDEHHFLSTISEFIDETKLTYAQTKILSESINSLKEVNNDIRSNTTVVEKTEGSMAPAGRGDNVYYIHSDILKRLNISENAEYVTKMTSVVGSDARVGSREIISAESLRISDHLRLQDLHNTLTHENTPMIFNHENLYEEYVDEESIVNENALTQNISKAMLLSYIDNLYQAKAPKFFSGDNHWYNTEHSYYGSVENTINRYTQNLVNPISNSVLTDFHSAEVNNFTTVQNAMNSVISQAMTTYRINSEENTIDAQVENFTNNIVNNNAENTVVNNNINENETTINYLNTQNEYNENREYTDEEILNALTKIEQHNVENQNQYIRALQNLTIAQNKEVTKKASRERQKAESLEALNNPEELILKYYSEAKSDEALDNQRRLEIIESLPPDVKTFVKIADRFLYHPTPEDKKLLGTDPLSALNRDIQAVNMSKLRPPMMEANEEIRHLDEQTANELIENITNTSVVRRNIENRVDEKIEQVSFVHKENTYIDEEELSQRFNELRAERTESQVVTNEIHHTEQVINKTEVTKEVINEVVQSDRVVQMVSQNVAEQLGNISDQVFQRLERKLTNEKRRRGL